MQHPTRQTARSPRLDLALGACVALLLGGCAALGLGGPGRLLEESERAAAAGEHQTAYEMLKRIASEYPDSQEAEEAFPIAASYFKTFYHHYRYREPNSAWITSDPAFMFEWLARYSDENPSEKADALLRGCPMTVFREFEAFAKTRPELARWTFRTEDDNGIITSVQAEPAEAADASSP
jgi:hypothetical protein